MNYNFIYDRTDIYMIFAVIMALEDDFLTAYMKTFWIVVFIFLVKYFVEIFFAKWYVSKLVKLKRYLLRLWLKISRRS